jgi:hypothetical protein
VDRDWSAVGVTTTDASGRPTFEDRSVAPSTRYAYRLGAVEHGRQSFSAETWVEVPARSRLALSGFQPNPARRQPLVAFALQEAGEARLEIHDVNGRCLIRREVGSLGPGNQIIRLSEADALPAGVYFLRLVQAGHVVTARGVILE